MIEFASVNRRPEREYHGVANDPAKIEPMLDRVVFPPEAHRDRGELLMIGGTGHFPFAEAPDRYWPALIDWLRRT
jgi:pimeloyl-ACP methyl ester carboxylesterase